MESTTRLRGRPRGSSRLNQKDRPFLAKAADLVLATPALKPTTAFRRLAPQASSAEIHRWQEKWRVGRACLLAAAEERQAMRERAAAARAVQAANVAAMGRNPLALQRMLEPSCMEAIRRIQHSPLLDAVRRMQELPFMETLRRIQESPMMKAISQIQASPVMQAIQRMQAGQLSIDRSAMRGLIAVQDVLALSPRQRTTGEG